ncbi:MFS-type transporter SLC18B1 [Lamellibrachia satsuma]|nr:MFS-type transporter SLC18B1 [Lamellibrachia satsuma]
MRMRLAGQLERMDAGKLVKRAEVEKHQGLRKEDARPVSKSFWSFARIPMVLLLGFLLVVFSFSIGFTDIALAVHVQTNYNLSPVMLGVVFLAATGVYGFSAPAWGHVADKKPHWGPTMVAVGSLISSTGLLLMGPAPFLHIPIQPLWLLNVSQALMGFGIGSCVVCFQEFFITATKHGYPDTLDTYGMVSGVFNFFFSLGLFLGPILGGYLNDTLDFEWAAAIISFMGSFALAMWVVYICAHCCRVDKTGESQPLLVSRS